jgi:hypothetical protein
VAVPVVVVAVIDEEVLEGGITVEVDRPERGTWPFDGGRPFTNINRYIFHKI